MSYFLYSMLIVLLVFTAYMYFINVFYILFTFNKIANGTHTKAHKVSEEDKRKKGREGGKEEGRKEERKERRKKGKKSGRKTGRK